MVPVAAKAGALLAVAAAGSTSIWYFSDSIFGKSAVSVADENPTPNYDDKSIGKNYSKYFLSVKSNENIWKKRYKDNESKFSNGENTKSKDKFGTVTEPFSNTTDTALNKICEAAYKEVTSGNLVEDEPSGSDATSKFVKRNIWKFCGLGPIFTVADDAGNYKEPEFSTSKIGGDTNSKKILVSTKKEENNWFWKIREEEFKKEDGSRSKKKAQGSDETNNPFVKSKNGTDSKSLSELCEETYKKDTNGNYKNKEDAELFCSIQLTIANS